MRQIQFFVPCKVQFCSTKKPFIINTPNRQTITMNQQKSKKLSMQQYFWTPTYKQKLFVLSHHPQNPAASQSKSWHGGKILTWREKNIDMAGKFRGLAKQTRMECTLECTFSPSHILVSSWQRHDDTRQKKETCQGFNSSQQWCNEFGYVLLHLFSLASGLWKYKTSEKTKFLSSSGLRGCEFISFYNFSAK